MSRPSQPPEHLLRRIARRRRRLIPAALFALTPKCVLCVLAYAGLGAMLGLGGPELCGATGNATASWASWLPALGAVVAGGYVAHRWLSRRPPS